MFADQRLSWRVFNPNAAQSLSELSRVAAVNVHTHFEQLTEIRTLTLSCQGLMSTSC